VGSAILIAQPDSFPFDEYKIQKLSTQKSRNLNPEKMLAQIFFFSVSC